MPLGPVIAGQGWPRYLRAMPAFLLKLFALVAVALMPLGMSIATASAPGAHHATAAGSASNCAGQDEPDAPAAPMDAECMACAGVAPAFAAAPADRRVLRAPRRIELSRSFPGIEPEIATPPPRA